LRTWGRELLTFLINLEMKAKTGLVVSVSEGLYQVRGSWAKKK
jgi:hypothetical protein